MIALKEGITAQELPASGDMKSDKVEDNIKCSRIRLVGLDDEGRPFKLDLWGQDISTIWLLWQGVLMIVRAEVEKGMPNAE